MTDVSLLFLALPSLLFLSLPRSCHTAALLNVHVVYWKYRTVVVRYSGLLQKRGNMKGKERTEHEIEWFVRCLSAHTTAKAKTQIHSICKVPRPKQTQGWHQLAWLTGLAEVATHNCTVQALGGLFALPKACERVAVARHNRAGGSPILISGPGRPSPVRPRCNDDEDDDEDRAMAMAMSWTCCTWGRNGAPLLWFGRAGMAVLPVERTNGRTQAHTSITGQSASTVRS
jgi:hypothetical protein